MLAVLVRAGVDASKQHADKGWSIEVGRSHLPKAMEVLKAEGYPRDSYDSLGQVFRKEGFVSTPLEERARLLYALSQELSHTISAIDGVVVARVHLAIPERRPLSDEQPPSSASVFIKHKPGSQVVNKAASIKALIVNSVEGLPYENVTVTFFVSEPPACAGGSRMSARRWVEFLLPDALSMQLDWLQDVTRGDHGLLARVAQSPTARRLLNRTARRRHGIAVPARVDLAPTPAMAPAAARRADRIGASPRSRRTARLAFAPRSARLLWPRCGGNWVKKAIELHSPALRCPCVGSIERASMPRSSVAASRSMSSPSGPRCSRRRLRRATRSAGCACASPSRPRAGALARAPSRSMRQELARRISEPTDR